MIWIVLGTGAAILLLLLVVAVSVRTDAAKRVELERVKMGERIAALKSERVLRPVLFEPAEEGNAWDLHTKALEAMAALSEEDIDDLQSYVINEPGVDLGKVDQLLQSTRTPIDELKRGLRRPWVEPDIRYEEGTEQKLPLMGPSIRAARILRASAKRHLATGKGEAAVEDIVAGLGLADHAAVKGGLLHGLVALVNRSIALSELKTFLANHDLPPVALERLARAMDKLEGDRVDFQDFLRREDLFARSTMRMFEERGEAGRSASWRDGFSGTMMAARSYSIQARFMGGLEQIATRPAWEREEAGRQLVDEIVATKSPLHLLMIPQVGRAWRNHWLSDAEWAVARVAVAVARHQAEQGATPATLQDLVPRYLSKIPADPCAPDSIKSVIKGERVTVYSNGYNRSDDGGGPPDTEEDDESGDIAWIIQRKKAAPK